jgi:hypothetical protein
VKRVQTGRQPPSQRSRSRPAPDTGPLCPQTPAFRWLSAPLAALALLGCNLENAGDLPPKAKLYFPNAIALSAHDASTPATHLFVANSNFDLRYRNGTVMTFSLDRLEEQLAATCPAAARCAVTESCAPPPDCTIPTEAAYASEVLIGSFSTALAMASSGSALFVSTLTDEGLSYMRLDGDNLVACRDGLACSSRVAPRTGLEAEELVWPGNPVAIISGPLSDWTPAERGLAGEYVMVAHRTGEVSLLMFRPGDPAGELVLIDVLDGLPETLTKLKYDPTTRLAYMSVAGGSGNKLLARVGVAIPEGADASQARLYNAGALELAAIQASNDTRDLAFVPAFPAAGAALAEDRALVVSTEPSALLVVDVDPARNQFHSARVERAVQVGAGPQKVVTGMLDGRPFAIVACFYARQLSVIDLSTMLTRSVVPNLSGPYDLVLDEARKLLYVVDFRSSVVRVVGLKPVVEPDQLDQPVRVIATLGTPQVLPELQ